MIQNRPICPARLLCSQVLIEDIFCTQYKRIFFKRRCIITNIARQGPSTKSLRWLIIRIISQSGRSVLLLCDSQLRCSRSKDCEDTAAYHLINLDLHSDPLKKKKAQLFRRLSETKRTFILPARAAHIGFIQSGAHLFTAGGTLATPGFHKKNKKNLLRLVFIAIALSVTLLVIDITTNFQRSFDAAYEPLAASDDPRVIARGEYLVYGPARCADCHGDIKQRDAIAAGKKVPLSGGFYEEIFLGTVRFPNITPDVETGIGRLSDDQLVRFMRTGINHRGEYGLPFMNYQRLNNPDLIAILSFLRAQRPVTNKVARTEYNFLGKLALAYFIKPEKPAPAFPDKISRTASIEYGRYLAEAMGSCRECHTHRSLKTGEYLGEFYAGGMRFEHPDKPKLNLTSPSLMADPASGKVAELTKETFIERMQAGQLLPWSPMPWGPYSRMTKTDIEAIYLYLASLKPAE